MIKITKQLQRPDGGTVASGSLIKFNPLFNKDSLSVRYNMTHYFSQSALDSKKKPVPGVTNFPYVLIKMCTPDEYLKLELADAPTLVEQWLADEIGGKIGVGNTVII